MNCQIKVCLIYNKNKCIGYTPTSKEADDICKLNHNLTWTYKRILIDNKIPQLTIHDTDLFNL